MVYSALLTVKVSLGRTVPLWFTTVLTHWYFTPLCNLWAFEFASPLWPPSSHSLMFLSYSTELYIPGFLSKVYAYSILGCPLLLPFLYLTDPFTSLKVQDSCWLLCKNSPHLPFWCTCIGLILPVTVYSICWFICLISSLGGKVFWGHRQCIIYFCVTVWAQRSHYWPQCHCLYNDEPCSQRRSDDLQGFFLFESLLSVVSFWESGVKGCFEQILTKAQIYTE